MMYCPLCKAEYRDWFNNCSDCLTQLVTREEAESTRVVLLWHGTNLARFDEIVAALRDAGIPNLSRSRAKSEEYRPSVMGFLPHLFGKSKQRLMCWEISVLESDYLKSAALLH